MKTEDYKMLLERGHMHPLWMELLNASGWAGCLPNGNIVDRRYFPEALPIQENSMFGIAKPKDLPNERK